VAEDLSRSLDEEKIEELANDLGIDTCIDFNIELLVPEERIRAFCLENKCHNYGKNYTCPPYVGSLQEIRLKLRNFQRGFLLQYSKAIDVKGDKEGVIQTKIDFHKKVIQMEEALKERGINTVWGMIGGNCELCDTCKAVTNEPCPYPDKARTSLEAIAIDVLTLLDKVGLDNDFHDDKITWTGCLLY
jgi:predicted metal-binding protein